MFMNNVALPVGVKCSAGFIRTGADVHGKLAVRQMDADHVIAQIPGQRDVEHGVEQGIGFRKAGLDQKPAHQFQLDGTVNEHLRVIYPRRPCLSCDTVPQSLEIRGRGREQWIEFPRHGKDLAIHDGRSL